MSAKNLNKRIICSHHCWPNAFARPQDCVDWWVWYHCWIGIHRHLNHMLQLGKIVYSLTFAHLVQNSQSHCNPPARKEKKRTPHCLSKSYLTYAAKNSKKILSYMPPHIALVHLLHNIFETTGAVETCFRKCWFKGVKRAELTSIRADRKSSDDRTLTGAL